MLEASLQGRKILVVEDEYLIADDLRKALIDAGAEVLGPVPTVEDASRLIEQEAAIDAAVLDVNLRGEMIFPAADALSSRGVPFVFATGYEEWSLPERFTNAKRLEKPLKVDKVIAALAAIFAPPD